MAIKRSIKCGKELDVLFRKIRSNRDITDFLKTASQAENNRIF